MVSASAPTPTNEHRRGFEERNQKEWTAFSGARKAPGTTKRANLLGGERGSCGPKGQESLAQGLPGKAS
jgi:hypothetical protein